MGAWFIPVYKPGPRLPSITQDSIVCQSHLRKQMVPNWATSCQEHSQKFCSQLLFRFLLKSLFVCVLRPKKMSVRWSVRHLCRRKLPLLHISYFFSKSERSKLHMTELLPGLKINFDVKIKLQNLIYHKSYILEQNLMDQNR